MQDVATDQICPSKIIPHVVYHIYKVATSWPIATFPIPMVRRVALLRDKQEELMKMQTRLFHCYLPSATVNDDRFPTIELVPTVEDSTNYLASVCERQLPPILALDSRY